MNTLSYTFHYEIFFLKNYDPRIGAWFSLDPLETPNRYAYVDGNVVNAVDPSGRILETPNTYYKSCQEQICPDGHVYHPDAGYCVPDLGSQCGSGRHYDVENNRCVMSSTTFLDCDSFTPGSPETHLCHGLVTAGVNQQGSATMHQYYQLSEILDWFYEQTFVIWSYANAYEIDPALLAGILLSELVWDYNEIDFYADQIVKTECALSYAVIGEDFAFNAALIDTAVGFANIHSDKWREQNEYLVSNGLLDSAKPYDQCHLVQDDGAIYGAAVFTASLVHQYGKNPYELSAEDMALIFGAYRGGVESYGDIADFQNWLDRKPLGPNGQISLPIMQYMIQAYGSLSDR